MHETRQGVFITGGTGYIGSRLIPRLRARGHGVRALVRRGSEAKLPPGCEAVVGNALDGNSYRDAVKPSETFIQLVGVAHPSPAKAAEFQRVDLVAGREAVIAAQSAGVRHFIYVSVAHPMYWLFESIPSMREGAQRLGLVTLEQMLQALTESVDHPCTGQRILGVPEIRRGTFDTAQVTVTA